MLTGRVRGAMLLLHAVRGELHDPVVSDQNEYFKSK